MAALAAAVLGATLLSGAALPSDATPSPTTSATPTPTPTSTGTPTPTPTGSAYYVDCSRSANGDGSMAHPWNRLAAVDQHGAFDPGDRILLRRGTSCFGHIAPQGSGTTDRPIVLAAFGSGARPVLNGHGTASGTGVVTLRNVQHWTVQDLHVTNRGPGAETSAYRAGVLLIDDRGGRLSGLTLQHLTVDHVVSDLMFRAGDAREFGGIIATTYGTRADGFNGLRIIDNSVSHVGRSGIVVSNHEYPAGSDSSTRIAGNTVSWARGDSIIMRGQTNGRIDHNVSSHGAALWPCKQCGRVTPQTADAGIWPAFSKNIRIDHNEVYGEHALGGDGEGFDIDASAANVVLEDNYAHDNGGGAILLCGSVNATVRFNIFQNNPASAIAFIGKYPAKKTSIYNNTIYQSGRTAANVVRTFDGKRGSGIRFFNNIVLTYDTSRYVWPTRVSSTANTYVGMHRTGEPHGSGTSFRDPGLARPGSGRTGMHSLGGYRKRSSAHPPAGHSIPTSVTRDFFGHHINPRKPPRGASA